MNHLNLRQYRARWLLAITPCLLSGASDVASPDSVVLPSEDGRPRKLETVTAKAPAANVGEQAPRIASSLSLESTTKLNEYIVSSSRVSELAASATSPVETISADELQQSGATMGLQDALKGMVPQFMGGGNRGTEGGTFGTGTGHNY